MENEKWKAVVKWEHRRSQRNCLFENKNSKERESNQLSGRNNEKRKCGNEIMTERDDERKKKDDAVRLCSCKTLMRSWTFGMERKSRLLEALAEIFKMVFKLRKNALRDVQY